MSVVIQTSQGSIHISRRTASKMLKDLLSSLEEDSAIVRAIQNAIAKHLCTFIEEPGIRPLSAVRKCMAYIRKTYMPSDTVFEEGGRQLTMDAQAIYLQFVVDTDDEHVGVRVEDMMKAMFMLGYEAENGPSAKHKPSIPTYILGLRSKPDPEEA